MQNQYYYKELILSYIETYPTILRRKGGGDDIL